MEHSDNNTRSLIDSNIARDYRFSFIMTLVAGHTTNYQNIRAEVTKDLSIKPTWNEIVYHQEGGRLERVHDYLNFLPSYPFGIARASLGIFTALKPPYPDAFYTNSMEAIFFTRTFKHTPTVVDADATPIQTDQMDAYQNKPDFGPVAKLKYKLFRNFVNSVRLINAWSEWARQSFINDYHVPPERVVVLPPGINLEKWQYYPRDEREASNPVQVLFVGGDFRRKNGTAVLEWFKQQPTGLCELNIVTREPVESTPGVKVYYDMKPNSPELMQLYRKSDIFVLPSLAECFGIATIEAMATGLPVVVSDVGGTADIVVEGLNGYIIAPNNFNSLHTALNNLISDPALRNRMGKAGREIAREKFDVVKNSSRTIELLKSVAG